MTRDQLYLVDRDSSQMIRSSPYTRCDMCGTLGERLYEGLQDRLFRATGTWNLKRCSNKNCGMLWLDPMPLEQDLAEAYACYYTHDDELRVLNGFGNRIYSQMQTSYLRHKYGYGSKGLNGRDALLSCLLFLNPPRRNLLDSLFFWLKPKPDARLLEVGCGNGSTLKMMQELGWQVEGVDFDEAAVKQARTKGLSVHFGTLEEQHLPEAGFDAIVARHLIEHVPNPLGMLQECYRLLKPGGSLVLVTPNARSWGHRRYGQNWRGLEPPRHLRVFTCASLAAVCTQAGFRLSACRSIVRSNTIVRESRQMKRWGRVNNPESSSWKIRLWTEITTFCQWVLWNVDREAGEEIAFIGLK